jgi:hypothetical protein
MSATKDRTSRPSAVQLVLLDGGRLVPRREWQLDERTRRAGRRGVAQAREILRRAKPPVPKEVADRKAS